MSTLVATNISDGTNSATTEAIAKGTPQTWVTYVGTGTVSISDDLNVSTITDNGTGDYTTNYTNNYSSTTYCIIASSSNPSTATYPGMAPQHDPGTHTARTTSSSRQQTWNTALVDNPLICLLITGTLA